MLPRSFRRGQQLATSRAGELIGATLAGMAGVSKPEIRWRITHGPWFYNMLSTLEFDGRKARIRLERNAPDVPGRPRLQPVLRNRTQLSTPAGSSGTHSRLPAGASWRISRYRPVGVDAWS
jgi:hypothetical protein